MASRQYSQVAISDIGTQLFWFNKDTNKFEYAIPITAGAEFGGDTETYEVNETDLDYTAKVAGRTTLNDVEYSINYTGEKYARANEISGAGLGLQVYVETFNDGSAAVFSGTSGMPSITGGDTRGITITIAPNSVYVVQNIYKLTGDDKLELDSLLDAENRAYYVDVTTASGTVTKLNIDIETIPGIRQKYFATNEVPVPKTTT